MGRLSAAPESRLPTPDLSLRRPDPDPARGWGVTLVPFFPVLGRFPDGGVSHLSPGEAPYRLLERPDAESPEGPLSSCRDPQERFTYGKG